MTARASGLAAAMLAVCATGAIADSAAPGYGGPGNLQNPGGLEPGLAPDPNGLSRLKANPRAPGGLMYAPPPNYPAMTGTADSDWWSLGWIEGGAIGTTGRNPGSADLARFSDRRSGLLLNSAGYQGEDRKTGFHISALAENAGRDDQYYQIEFGRYGEYRVRSFFDSVPHTYTSQARSIWDGAGTGLLTLKPGLTSAASTATQVTNIAAAASPQEARILRQKAGTALTYTPDKEWEFFLQFTHEWRDGEKPISATFGYVGQNGATQIFEPVHYLTLDVNSAARYKTDTVQANLTYTGSFFHNDVAALTWQNPGLASQPAGRYVPPAGQLSLPPSNSYHNMKADVSALLSDALRFSSSLSYSLMRQDEPLLAPAIGTATINGQGGPIRLTDWNTPAALSRPRAGAAINQFNAFAQLQYSVSPDMELQLELRDHDEANLTNYLAFNPQTGQYGYIALDGGLASFAPALSGVYAPAAAGSFIQIRNMPFANDTLELSARGTYRLDPHTRLDASYRHNNVHHSIRYIEDADDDRFRLQIAATGFDWGSVRASYEYGALTGSERSTNPYTPYYTASLPGYIPRLAGANAPFALDDMTQFDIGSRAEHAGHVQGNIIAAPDTDLTFGADYKSDSYDTGYGLRFASSLSANAAVNYAVSRTAELTGFLTWQLRNRSMASINPAGALGASGAAGSASFPLANAWNSALSDRSLTAGFTLHQGWDVVSLDVNYVFAQGDSAQSYRYATPGAFANAFTAAQAGTGLPDISSTSHTLEANALWQADAHATWRLYYRFDYAQVDDYHYQGLAPVIGNDTYLGISPENYSVQTVGVSLRYAF